MKNVSNLIILKRETHYQRLTINQLLSACLALIILINRFHCVARLFSNGSRMTSNVVKNRKVRQKAQQSVSLMFLSHLDVICERLLYRITTTWSPFVLYILYDKKTVVNSCIHSIQNFFSDCNSVGYTLSFGWRGSFKGDFGKCNDLISRAKYLVFSNF